MSLRLKKECSNASLGLARRAKLYYRRHGTKPSFSRTSGEIRMNQTGSQDQLNPTSHSSSEHAPHVHGPNCRHDHHHHHHVQPFERTAPKVGRNEECPCGSGKKFKKCCG
jgi:preprotein translocase subunit SecA